MNQTVSNSLTPTQITLLTKMKYGEYYRASELGLMIYGSIRTTLTFENGRTHKVYYTPQGLALLSGKPIQALAKLGYARQGLHHGHFKWYLTRLGKEAQPLLTLVTDGYRG